MTPTTGNGVTNALESNDRTSGIRSRMNEMTQHVKNTASEFGKSAVDNIDRSLDRASGALEGAASTLRSRAGVGGGRVNDFAHTAADKLDSTARYFRDHHTREMMSDFEGVVKRNPGASVAAALGIGFIIGMTLKRDRDNY